MEMIAFFIKRVRVGGESFARDFKRENVADPDLNWEIEIFQQNIPREKIFWNMSLFFIPWIRLMLKNNFYCVTKIENWRRQFSWKFENFPAAAAAAAAAAIFPGNLNSKT